MRRFKDGDFDDYSSSSQQSSSILSNDTSQTGTVGIACNIPLPSASDSDGDTLTYTATGLPTGCSFDALNRKIV